MKFEKVELNAGNGYQLLKHFGVYAVAKREGQLLVIKKNSGPYQNRFDLPGGSQEIGETMLQTLYREVKEETGLSVLSQENNRIYSAWVCEEKRQVMTHHIFNLYDVKLNDQKESLPKFVKDGKNDSDGIVWIDFTQLSEANSSPLVLKIVEEVFQCSDVDKATIFKNWKIIK